MLWSKLARCEFEPVISHELRETKCQVQRSERDERRAGKDSTHAGATHW
jgi:hypothetical protein